MKIYALISDLYRVLGGSRASAGPQPAKLHGLLPCNFPIRSVFTANGQLRSSPRDLSRPVCVGVPLPGIVKREIISIEQCVRDPGTAPSANNNGNAKFAQPRKAERRMYVDPLQIIPVIVTSLEISIFRATVIYRRRVRLPAVHTALRFCVIL